MTGSLWSDFQTNQGRVIHKWAHYFPVYERHFAAYRDKPILFIEIGSGAGGSLQMWKRYFGPNARIVGLDMRPECKAFEEDQVEIRIGDQSDPAFLNSVIAEFGAPDIVMDDGSHVMEHVIATFNTIYKQLMPQGVYAVEDMHTAYMPEFGGGQGVPGSFIELTKALIDELNGNWLTGNPKVTDFSRSTQSMHFYNSMVVFEKGRVLPNRTFASGAGRVWSV